MFRMPGLDRARRMASPSHITISAITMPAAMTNTSRQKPIPAAVRVMLSAARSSARSCAIRAELLGESSMCMPPVDPTVRRESAPVKAFRAVA